MCSSPLTIKNPFYRLGNIGMNALHNTVDSKIQVPCGNCPQCICMRQSFFLQRVQMESLRSYLFMFTLTYNDNALYYVNIGEYNIAVPELRDVQNMFKRLRKRFKNIRYTYTSEYGKKLFRPHFHGIIALEKELYPDYRLAERELSNYLSLEWRRNLSAERFTSDYIPLYTPVYSHGRCVTFDCHYIEPVMNHDNDVSFYVSKYITKYDSRTTSLLQKIKLDTNLSGEEIIDLTKAIKPRCNTSKDFGDWKFPAIREYIIKCTQRESLFTYPQYYDIYTGKQMPMSPYYGKHCVGFKHLYNRLINSDDPEKMSTTYTKNTTSLEYRHDRDSILKQRQEYEKKLNKLFNRLEV